MTAIIGTNGNTSKPCDSDHGTASAPNQKGDRQKGSSSTACIIWIHWKATASGSDMTGRKAAGDRQKNSRPRHRQHLQALHRLDPMEGP